MTLLLPAIASGAPTLNHIHHIDALTLLKALPDASVDCVVTSPPYYALRDYGVDGQIGLEDTPAAYIERLMQLFREVRRVLKSTGTVWVNLGDSYSGNGSLGRNDAGRNFTGGGGNKLGSGNPGKQGQISASYGLPAKSLMMIPARFAIAMQDAGWILRSEIIWAKRAPMPESVTDRPTKAHEMIYLFAKEGRYFYDQEAVREKAKNWGSRDRSAGKYTSGIAPISGGKHGGLTDGNFAEIGRNLRDVWHLSPEPTTAEHYAAYPTEIPRRCILAGCPVGGVVLDMFSGTGTTAYMARKLGRSYIGCDLNLEYVEMSRRRLSQSDPYQHRQVGEMKQLSMFAGVSL